MARIGYQRIPCSYNRDESSPFQNDLRTVKLAAAKPQKSTLVRSSSAPEIKSLREKSKIAVPNLQNAFFASGGVSVDLDTIKSEGQYKKEIHNDQNSAIDRSNMVLKLLKLQAPKKMNPNQQILNNMKTKAKDKVSYAYKERFCGIYEDRKRNGLIEKEDSFEKFYNPKNGVSVGDGNHF